MNAFARAVRSAPVAARALSSAPKGAKPTDDPVVQLFVNEIKAYQATKEGARKKPLSVTAEAKAAVTAEVDSIKRAQGLAWVKNKIPDSVKL